MTVRVLLDECVPRKLRRELPEHDVKTVAEVGWSGVSNGELLRKAARRFDVFLTVDANLEYQQHLAALPIPVVVLIAHSNAIDVLRPLMSEVRALLPTLEWGKLYRIPLIF